MSHKGSVAIMIYYVRQRAAADGHPLDHVTDWEINHYGIGVDYIMPEIRADIEAGIRKFSSASEYLAATMDEAARAAVALGKAWDGASD